jgi:PKD repeat protein
MKNILLIIITLGLALTSCEVFYGPQAKFDVSENTVIPYQEIKFYNRSEYAQDYEWSFGDGYVSNEPSPVHYYTEPGVYEVRLSAFKDDQVSDAYYTITVIAPDLVIQVREFFNKYVVPDAKVILYPTLQDWTDQTRRVATAYTDNEGYVEFYNLAEGFYYLDISNDATDHDNYSLANEDVAYIKTPYVGGMTTSMTAYVDHYPLKTKKVDRKYTPKPTTRPFKPEMSILIK